MPLDLPAFAYDALQRYVNSNGEILNKILQDAYAPFRGKEKALEIGCGTGLCSPLFPADAYCGVDTEQSRLDKAHATHPEHQFLCADVTALEPKFLGEFGFIFCRAVIHHIDDAGVNRLFDAIARAASASGRDLHFFALEPILPPFWRNPPGWVLNKLDRGRWVRTHAANLRLFGDRLVSTTLYPPLRRWPVPSATYLLRFRADAPVETKAQGNVATA